MIHCLESKLRLWVEAALLALKYGFPRTVLWFNGGIGDHLLCTAVAREMRKRRWRGVWIVTLYPELFIMNSDFDAVISDKAGVLKSARLLGARTIEPRYAIPVPGEDREIPPGCHIIAKMCQLAGVAGEVELRPYLKLNEKELKKGVIVQQQVAIQSSNLGGRWPAKTKEWFPNRFQMVIDTLSKDFKFVQVGSPLDPPLAGVIDMRGKTQLRETAAILSNSVVFVGTIGFLMHLARAVKCPSVIIYGGRELPSESAYSANENLYVALPCSPCWKYDSCEIDLECMQRISVDEVVRAIRRKADSIKKPLTVERAWVA